MSRSLQLFALQPFPLVQPGDDIAGLVFQALAANELELVDGDVLVMAQ
jgi:coenzyme F420-0:L-glutamate ligase/coenzyme F420-1:gamma-L-glutamate ligase